MPNAMAIFVALLLVSPTLIIKGDDVKYETQSPMPSRLKNMSRYGNWTINILCYNFKLYGDMIDIFPYNAGLWVLVFILNILLPGFPLLSGIPLFLIMILGAIYKPTTLGLWIVGQSRGHPLLYAQGLLGETKIEKKEGILVVITMGFTGVISPALRPNAVGTTLFMAAK